MASNIKQETVRFNLAIPAQARAYAIYEAMLADSPDCKTVGTLLPKVLTVLAPIAKDHPSLCNRTAILIAKHQEKVLAVLARLEAGENLDHLLTRGVPSPTQHQVSGRTLPLPPAVEDSDITIDFDKL